ncbi:hypothetical protein LB542_04715 [Mesorhizobium sp. BR1-1-9]|uniref:hypothetical protein n=1 Tax=unclassified Mesorhizobium TaxID=325217 RepID=UPI001CD17CD1|nr:MULTISPECIES: hypothetical protein [unclassified Mesorhizobium]MBZ9870165.1 hypothetical protein [Mesorhizobium sp. BR1-1-9]MBZ9943954.1 hypothetical protein [Mesorhizobium sp. BR1-1-13]
MAGKMLDMDKGHTRLMYLFGSFKPSERAILLDSANTNAKPFIEALDLFLTKWAAAPWVEEYNVERVGEWIAAKCPPSIRRSAKQVAERGLDRAEGNEASIRTKTYRAFLDGMKRHPQPKSAVVLSLHA